MRLISWNVNGIRAVHKKGFLEWFESERSDVLCVQETKAHEVQLPKLETGRGLLILVHHPGTQGLQWRRSLHPRRERSPQRHIRPWRRAFRQ